MNKRRGCRFTLKFMITANRNDFHLLAGGVITPR
jgi:hypothetical protein